MRNPLTQATGPEFLALFAILIGATILVCWWRQWARDSSAELPPLRPPEKIDPYELAYLRAGANEMARVLIVSLIERKYLQITTLKSAWWKGKDRSIERARNNPPPANLTPIELATFEWFDHARTAEAVFKRSTSLTEPGDLPSALTQYTLKYEQKLRADRLLTSDELQNEARGNVIIAIAVVTAIGIARLFIGISRGRPVGFLILMGILGSIAIATMGRPGRLSRRGKQYLDTTQRTWGWLKNSGDSNDWSPSLAAAVFGFAVLSGTEMSPLNEMFTRANHNNAWGGDGGSGGCGGGCGGGGCGGGCGGCGG